jgi:hypothetical protein
MPPLVPPVPLDPLPPIPVPPAPVPSIAPGVLVPVAPPSPVSCEVKPGIDLLPPVFDIVGRALPLPVVLGGVPWLTPPLNVLGPLMLPVVPMPPPVPAWTRTIGSAGPVGGVSQARAGEAISAAPSTLPSRWNRCIINVSAVVGADGPYWPCSGTSPTRCLAGGFSASRLSRAAGRTGRAEWWWSRRLHTCLAPAHRPSLCAASVARKAARSGLVAASVKSRRRCADGRAARPVTLQAAPRGW